MTFLNETRGEVLARRGRLADTFGRRLRGLLGKRRLSDGEGVALRPCAAVHTFFLPFSIDVLFLDPAGRVEKACEGLPPFRVASAAPPAETAVELPEGTIRRTGTAVGDRVVLTTEREMR